MNKFVIGQKKITTVLTIWVIVCIATVTSIILPMTQNFAGWLLIGFPILSAIVMAAVTAYAKRLLHDADVLERQLDFLPNRGSNDRLNDSYGEARSEAEENKHLEQVASDIAVDLEQTADLNDYFDKLLSNFAKVFDIVQGVAYALNPKIDKFEIKSTYAYYTPDTDRTFELGEGINGQVAKDKKILMLDNIPENYIQVVVSGLGQGSPKHLIFIPIVFNGKTIALVELATFEKKGFNLNLLADKINKRVAQHIADNINITAA
ncbi:MAG: GAF domain-containing protein [Bacteroidales bacterium]|nr:GAF domain-containing protein [Bacteroidales bacterium]